jgi:hypothetical protein
MRHHIHAGGLNVKHFSNTSVALNLLDPKTAIRHAENARVLLTTAFRTRSALRRYVTIGPFHGMRPRLVKNKLRAGRAQGRLPVLTLSLLGVTCCNAPRGPYRGSAWR